MFWTWKDRFVHIVRKYQDTKDLAYYHLLRFIPLYNALFSTRLILYIHTGAVLSGVGAELRPLQVPWTTDLLCPLKIQL